MKYLTKSYVAVNTKIWACYWYMLKASTVWYQEQISKILHVHPRDGVAKHVNFNLPLDVVGFLLSNTPLTLAW